MGRLDASATLDPTGQTHPNLSKSSQTLARPALFHSSLLPHPHRPFPSSAATLAMVPPQPTSSLPPAPHPHRPSLLPWTRSSPQTSTQYIQLLETYSLPSICSTKCLSYFFYSFSHCRQTMDSSDEDFEQGAWSIQIQRVRRFFIFGR